MKVMLLDDNVDAVVVVESFLKALGHQVASFSDGREALLWLHDFKPEVIIADLDMPALDGYDFLKRVRAHSAYANVPIICLTGTDASDAEIVAGGFAKTLRKPTTLSDVMLAIDSVVSEQEGAQVAAPAPEKAAPETPEEIASPVAPEPVGAAAEAESPAAEAQPDSEPASPAAQSTAEE